MEQPSSVAPQQAPLKLNMKRTFIIGFAFFGILLMWQVYDNYCSSFLSELFIEAFGLKWTTPDEHKAVAEQVQWLVGIMMAIDNIAALVMMPIFGRLSDKTKSPIGKRMPYILIGTFICAVAFPFIPIAFHHHILGALIPLMAITVFSAMMYRNPAVALMPDLTPKPLRSKANGIINIMGYLGGAIPSVLGIFLSLSSYLNTVAKPKEGQVGNLWVIEIPFLLASICMVASVVVLFLKIKENKITEEIADDMARGEALAEVADSVADDEEKPMTKANKIMLFAILGAEFFWFMADNGVGTFLSNYTIYHLQADTSLLMVNTIISGVASVVGFAIAGFIAAKIGRKWSIISGLALTALAYGAWLALSLALQPNGQFPIYIFIVFFFKGFGMSMVHVNSLPMVLELCSAKKVGRFTSYYYAASMAAQTVTPCALGLLLMLPNFGFDLLPLYALSCIVVAAALFFLVKNIRKHENFAVGLEAIGEND